MARRRRFPDEHIIEAIRQNRGLVYLAAHALGCSAKWIYERAKTNPKVQEAIEEATEVQLDVTEGKLIQAINRDDAWAIRFYLQTKGKSRGYGEEKKIDLRATIEVGLPEGME